MDRGTCKPLSLRCFIKWGICRSTLSPTDSFEEAYSDFNIFDLHLTPRKSLATDYDNLTRNLDKNSIETIDAMIYRWQMINRYADTFNYFDLWTDKELSQLREIFFLNDIDLRLRNIVELSDRCYIYGGYKLPMNYFTVSVHKFRHGIEELKTLKRIGAFDLIDAGANIGDSAAVLSPYTIGKVHSFEPLAHLFELMLETIHLNDLSNVIPLQCALGSEPGGTLRMDCNRYQISNSDFISDSTMQTVEAISLDEYVKRNHLRIGFIKTDLEGYERNFLCGAENTIKQQRPALSISIYHSYEDFFTIKPLIESWDLGYTFRVLKPLDGRILSETILLAEVL